MKLHLPKLLLTAVLAAVAMAPAAWATTAWSGTDGNTDTWTVQANDNIDTATASPNGDNNLFLRDQANTGNITANLTVSDLGKAYTVKIQGDENNTNNFNKLTIGTLTLNDADATLEISANNSVYFNSITASPTCAGINVYGTLELASGNAYQRLYVEPTATSSDSDDAVDINVKNGGILDLTVYKTTPTGGSSRLTFDYWKGINNNQNITTEAGGWIKLADGFQPSLDSPYLLVKNNAKEDFTLNKNTWVNGGLRFNSWGKGGAVNVLTGKALKLTNDLKMESGSVLNINGGSVEASSVILGHNNTNENNPGSIQLSNGGTLKVGTITLNSNGNQNTVTMTDGVLEITGTKAITAGTNTTSTIAIGGTETGKTVVLKATSQDWTLDYASGLTVKNVTIDAGNTRKITIDNATLDGSIINNKTLELGSGNTVSALALSGSGTTTLVDGFTNAGTLNIASGSTVYLGGSITNNGEITGTLSISSLIHHIPGSGTFTGGLNDGNGVYAGSYVIISSESTNKSGISISYNNTTYTTDANGAITPTTGDNTIFQITNTEAGEKVSTINGIDSVTKINMKNGTGLIVDANTSDIITVASGDSATLELNSASTDALSVSSFSADSATIKVTKNAASASSELSLGNKAHTIGSLVIGDGVTVSSTYTHNDTANEYGFIKDSLTINAGGTFKHSGNGRSPFGQGTGKLGSITMGGGTKTASILLTNRSVIGGTRLTLNGNTLIGSATAEGAVTDANESTPTNRDNRAILDFDGNNEVSVSGTGNVVDAALRLRGGITTFNVKKTESVTGELTINGNIFKANNGTFAKKGDGKLIIGSASSEMHTVNVYSGTMQLNGGTHSFGTLDMSCTGNVGVGTVTLKKSEEVGKQVVLTASTLWLRSAATLNIEEGASLKLGNNGIVNIKGTVGNTSSVSTTETDGKSYAVEGGDSTLFTISNAEVSVDTTSGNKKISNILSNSKLINAGSNKLTATNGNSNFSAIDATKGNIDLTWFNQQGLQNTLQELTIGAGKIVGIYKGNAPATPATDNEASITVASLTAGTGATLNANLELSSGATVTLANALTMGSTLTLNEGMTLSGALVSTIKGMSDDGTVDLFTGVDTLYLGNSTTASGALDATSGVNLDTYFAFEGASKYYLGYSGGNVFAGVIPEPTTATLSLLALAGLAARRRRK